MNAPQPLDNNPFNNKQAWFPQANCRGTTHHMFPKHHKDTTYIKQARELCDGCKVRAECLEYALEWPAADMHGVWAGLTPRQLAAEQRRRGVRPVRPTIAQLWGLLSGGGSVSVDVPEVLDDVVHPLDLLAELGGDVDGL